jgi:hypothetical protein
MRSIQLCGSQIVFPALWIAGVGLASVKSTQAQTTLRTIRPVRRAPVRISTPAGIESERQRGCAHQ